MAQLYLHERVTPVVEPLIQLKKFERVHLRKGESRQITWTLAAEDMEIVSADELEAWIKKEYLSLSGKPLTDEYMDFAVIDRFKHGGMSSGGVDNRFWTEKAIPLLKSRLMKL